MVATELVSHIEDEIAQQMLEQMVSQVDPIEPDEFAELVVAPTRQG
jgi:hypothetical protein